MWTGLYVSSSHMLTGKERWLGLLSPVFTTLLLSFVSGIPLLERKAMKQLGSDSAYLAYRKKTPVLVPFVNFPWIWNNITMFKDWTLLSMVSFRVTFLWLFDDFSSKTIDTIDFFNEKYFRAKQTTSSRNHWYRLPDLLLSLMMNEIWHCFV